jgi:hypothetical protein
MLHVPPLPLARPSDAQLDQTPQLNVGVDSGPAESEAAPLPSSASRSGEIHTDEEESRPVVLNVEDFEPARFRRSRLLRDAGFDIVEAGTASEALLVVTEHSACSGVRPRPCRAVPRQS